MKVSTRTRLPSTINNSEKTLAGRFFEIILLVFSDRPSGIRRLSGMLSRVRNRRDSRDHHYIGGGHHDDDHQQQVSIKLYLFLDI